MDDLINNEDFINKKEPKDLIAKGLELGKQHKFKEALLLFEAYLAINPWNELIINNKSHCYAGMNEFDKAKEFEIKALTLNPKLAIGWCTLGEIQSKTKECFCARLNIELAMELTPKDHQLFPVLEKYIRDLDDGKELAENVII